MMKSSLNRPDDRQLMSKNEKKGEEDNENDDDEDDVDNNDEDDDDEWWASDSGSSSGSYYSDTDSSIAEWESEIGPKGQVFYIESCLENRKNNIKQGTSEQLESLSPELTRRRSTRAGKLMRLIRRRESKRYSTRVKKFKNIDGKQSDGNLLKEGNSKEVKFQDYQAGEIREVMLWVDPKKRHKLGRRATLCEVYLGITPGDFSDKIRVMVAGFIPDGEAIKNKNIKIGDWLKSINSRDVSLNNLEYILSDIKTAMSVKLELQRVAGIEVTSDGPLLNVPKQSKRVKRLIDRETSQKFMESLLDYSFGIIYLETSGLSETGPELQGVLYSYPRSDNKSSHSILCTARGAFITLNHMLPETINSQPISTSILVGSEKIHILYTQRDKELMLLAIPERWLTLEESIQLLNDVIKNLELLYQTLNKCFTDENNHSELDHLFYLIFTRLLRITTTMDDCFNEQSMFKNLINHQDKCEFEYYLNAIQKINLPIDAQIQIDGTLNEMEAMDYRDWNEDPMDCQRLYTILGTCLYHKSYLLASHLPNEDLIQVNTFLRQNEIFNLIENEPIKCLVIWQSVFPQSCNRGMLNNDNSIQIPNAKWFILVVGFEHELLAAILEVGGCTAQPKDNEGPDVFYVEEAQETLKHIQKIEIPTLASKWISSNSKPETVDIKDKLNVKSTSTLTENLLGFIKSSETQNTYTKSSTVVNVNKKTVPEVTSILKKRSPEQSPVMSGSVYSLQTSEDSMSQGTGAVSEMSDEAAPILGRRATRENNYDNSRQSDDSDSDVDIYRNNSQSCSMNISDIRDNLLNQAEYIFPMKLTSGNKNCLLHFVYLDALKGILLSSKTIENPDKNSEIINTFNQCAHKIHKLLNNAVRFKKMLNDDDVDKTAINKNLVAVKEHGVLFEYENISFWVIGRLFLNLHPVEFYVCYEDSVPQNLVEMAFRLQNTWS